MPYVPPKYDAVIPDAVESKSSDKTTVLIVGAGPIGLALALDLGLRGHPVIVVTKNTQLTDGSRALCYAKRPLEILDRLGIAKKMVEKGVCWNIGRVFFKERKDPVYNFDLLPIKDQKLPAMINIQQYYNEEYNIEALEQLENVEIRWGNQLVEIENLKNEVVATVKTDSGSYKIFADWMVACDGASSPSRKMLDINFEGETFQDNFLIADVKFNKQYPTERHFWFDPPFNPGQSVLLHKQPDNIWRIDFQVGWDIDREEITKPENVAPRVRAIFGNDIEFEFEWISVYTFNCRQIEKMVEGRVIFAGDSAHLVSPFGARGANTGFQDIDNLAWKLDFIIRKMADSYLLKSYNEERLHAAEINILNSTRSTDFITPKSEVSRQFRDAVLQLAAQHEFARGFVNSGRLSLPVPYPDSTLNTPDDEEWQGGLNPGTNCIDAPISYMGEKRWLLNLLGWQFKLLVFVADKNLAKDNYDVLLELTQAPIPLECLFIGDQLSDKENYLTDHEGIVKERYGIKEVGIYLIRPDQYVAARWKSLNVTKISKAILKASCNKSSKIH